jgi:hypothetical protein
MKPRVSKLAGDVTIGKFAQALGGNGRASNGSAEPLEPLAIEGVYGNTPAHRRPVCGDDFGPR